MLLIPNKQWCLFMLEEHSEPIMLGKRIDWSASRSRCSDRRANVRYFQVHQQPEAKLACRMRRRAARLPKASPKNVFSQTDGSATLPIFVLDCPRLNVKLAALQGAENQAIDQLEGDSSCWLWHRLMYSKCLLDKVRNPEKKQRKAANYYC